MACGLQYVRLPSGRRVLGRRRDRGRGEVQRGHYCHRVTRERTAADRTWCELSERGRCRRRRLARRDGARHARAVARARTNPWVAHLRAYVASHPGVTWSEAMRLARPTYVRSGAPIDGAAPEPATPDPRQGAGSPSAPAPRRPREERVSPPPTSSATPAVGAALPMGPGPSLLLRGVATPATSPGEENEELLLARGGAGAAATRAQRIDAVAPDVPASRPPDVPAPTPALSLIHI